MSFDDCFGDDLVDDGAVNTILLLDVRIVKILYVTRRFEWLYPIINDAQEAFFPTLESNQNNCRWTLDKALLHYRGVPVVFGERNFGAAAASNGAEQEDEPLDLATAIDIAGVDSSEVAYNKACEKRFESFGKTVGVLGRCLVECTVARGGRQRVDERVLAYVTGEWPVLADCVRYEIRAVPKVYGRHALAPGQTQLPGARKDYDAVGRGCGIYPSQSTRVPLADFYNLLLHTCRMPERAVNTIVQRMFPTIYQSHVTSLEHQVHRTVVGPNGLALDYQQPFNNEFDVAELRDILDRGGAATSWVSIENKHVLFPTVAAFFYRQELSRIAAAYKTRNTWYQVLARGCGLVRHLAYLIDHAPQTLNVKQLKYVECLRKQKEIDAHIRQLLRSGNERPSPQTLARMDCESASLRGLMLLPERTYAQCFDTVMANKTAKRQNVLSNADLAVAMTGLDIYTLLQIDQTGNDALYSDESQKKRAKASQHGKTSGHMYFVIDDTPRVDVMNCDPSSSLGAVRLDDVQPVAPPQNAMAIDRPTSASHHDDNDAETLAVPLVPRAVSSTTVAARPARVAQCFNDIINRMASPCSVDEFVAGMRWLIDKGVVKKVEMIGTGPRNKGRPFDAFYLSSVYAVQAKYVSALSDVYRRGMMASVAHYNRVNALDFDVAAAQTVRDRRVLELREKIAYFDEARQVYRSLCMQHAELMRRTKVSQQSRELEAYVDAGDQQSSEVAADEESLLANFRVFLAEVKSFVAGQAEPLDPNDPYADLIPEPAPGERSLCFRLLRSPIRQPLSDDIDYCAEQVRAIERSPESPITIISGRAGCGKTATLQEATALYPPEQLVNCAITGRVVSELQRRVGNARTIHSLLFAHLVLYRQELQKAEGVLAALRAAVRASGRENSPFAEIVNIRSELHRILGVFDHPSPFENKRVIVIDEGSLVPFAMMEQLLSAIHQHKERTGCFIERIIVCGDPNQLYPIGYGSVMWGLIHAYPWCVHHMTINHRSDGAAIFNFANSILKRTLATPACPMPRFGGDDNYMKLLTPTKFSVEGLSPQQIVEARATADEASIVFLQATSDTLATTVETALSMLGALDKPATPAIIALRKSILMIASTRFIVGRLNSITRALLYRDTIESIIQSISSDDQFTTSEKTGELMLPPAFETRVVPGQKIILRRNSHKTFYVEDDTDGVAVYSTPRVDKLRNLAYERGMRKTAPMRKIVNHFYNGEMLDVVCFYDSPYELRKTVWCRCGLCPPPQDDETGQSSCMLEPHEVPVSRRTEPDIAAPHTIKFHSQGLDFKDGAWTHKDPSKRRMAVVRVSNQPDCYKEFDVTEQLGSLSQFAFAQAATVHVFQGSETPIAMVVAPSKNPYTDWTAFYTACTRARERLVIIGDREAIVEMVQREPTLRRSDEWALLALYANAVHRELHDASDPLFLAKVLKIDDPLTQALVDTRRDLTSLSRAEMWRDYERIKEQAYAPVQNSEE